MSDKKNWFDVGLGNIHIAAGNNTNAQLVNMDSLKTRLKNPHESEKVYSNSGELPSFTMTFEGEAFTPPPVSMTYDLIISAGEKQAKAVIESMEDMKRLHDGEAVDVNWYRLVDDEWEFVERRPLKINRQGLPE